MANRFYIYIATNTVNNESYIGKSNDIKKRWKHHVNDALARRDTCIKLHRAIRKYGADKFIIEILASFRSEAAAYEAEARFIEEYDTYENGLNACPGGRGASSGEGHPMFGTIQSPEKRQKHSTFMKEYYKTHPHPMSGTKISPKVRKALDRTGQVPWNKGKTFSIEYKAKLAKSHNPNQKGSAIGTSKLTEKNVLGIANLMRQGKSNNEILDILNHKVGWTTIDYIRKGKSWKHLNLGELPPDPNQRKNRKK